MEQSTFLNGSYYVRNGRVAPTNTAKYVSISDSEPSSITFNIAGVELFEPTVEARYDNVSTGSLTLNSHLTSKLALVQDQIQQPPSDKNLLEIFQSSE
jgi:hypothetical protein